jgi:hypothetical protein
MKLYILGLVLAYSSTCMVSLTISSVAASRSLVYASASTSHLEYLNRVSASFNPHYISTSIKASIGQGGQAAYVLRLIGGGTTSNEKIFNGAYRGTTIIVKAVFHGLSVATGVNGYFLLTYGSTGCVLDYAWASLSTVVGSVGIRLLVSW